MNHRKWVHTFFFYTLVLVGFVLIALMATSGAHASGRDNNNPPPFEAGANARSDADAHAEAEAGAYAGASSDSINELNASGSGTGEATNEGNNNVTNAKTTFFSFNRSMPAAGKCFGTIDGGAGSDGGAGFLGINYLNKNCWYAALAADEQSVEVKARLKCGSKIFRNAISYASPRNKRQRDCISFMAKTYIDQLTFERKQLDDALTAQTLIIQDHITTATERTTDTLTRVVETCSDCYGENSK